MFFDVDVSLRLGGRTISCCFQSGEGLTVLFGRSGAGKSSVLNMVAGLLRPQAGHVRVADVTLFDRSCSIDVPVQQRRAGYVFQEPRLFPHLRVERNLLYGAHGRPASFDHLVAVLGIQHLLDRWPRTLSGGEARRVAIGRALLSDARFLLLDEPLSSLDQARRQEIMGVIERLRDELRLPILMVTHDADEAARLANRIVEI